MYARVLRSPHPHARVRRIDTAKAAALPAGGRHARQRAGVVGRWLDCRRGAVQRRDQKITTQRRYIFNNPVRFCGHAAAVAAIDRHTAEALDLIAVDYEQLPFVVDPAGGSSRCAPGLARGQPRRTRDEAAPTKSRRGNVDEGFAAADQIFEDRYSTAFVHDAQMEPRACLAHWEGTSSRSTPRPGDRQLPARHRARSRASRRQGRITCQYMGGNFGNKNQNQDADLIAAMLAKQAGAPVMLELSRREDWLGMHGRWHTVQYYKVGAKKDGTVTAVQLHGLQRHGRLSQELRARSAAGALRLPERGVHGLRRLHEPDDIRKFPRPIGSPGLLRHRVDDGRRRISSGSTRSSSR